MLINYLAAEGFANTGNLLSAERSLSFVNSDNLFAILLALASALSIAWGTVVRHQLSFDLPEDTGTMRGVLRSLGRVQWWAGAFLAMLGYGLQLAALAFGTLLLVQPILVMSLMFTLPLSARVNGYRISKSETAWALLLTVAVALLVGLGRPSAGDPQVAAGVWAPALGFGAVAYGIMYWLAVSEFRKHKAFVFGFATGWLYGYVALLSKAVMDVYTRDGFVALVDSWQLWLLIALAMVGVGVQQAAFNAGPLQQSLPAMTIVEPIVAFALGYIVLGERFSTHGWQWILLGAALVAMIVSTVELSKRGVSG